MSQTDGPEPITPAEGTPPAPAAPTGLPSAPSTLPSELPLEAAEPAKTIPTEEPQKADAQEPSKLVSADPQKLTQVAPTEKTSDIGAGDSQPTVQSILELFDRLNPRDQLDRLMLDVGMPSQHRPSHALDLSQREAKIVDWAARAGGTMMGKLDAALKDLISNKKSNEKKGADKRTPHPKAPKASMRDATSELRKDRELVRSGVETLAPAAGGLLPIGAPQTVSWAERLHAQRLLLLSCEDPGTLNSVARTVPFHGLFADVEKLQVARQDSPTVWQILEARRPAPGVVVAYAVGEFGERWMRNLPSNDFDLTNLRAELERTLTWLLVLTTPETAKRAHFDFQGPWIEARIDFMGPRLRSALGPDCGDLEVEFKRQHSKGYWGESDHRTLQLLNDAISNGTLKNQIEIQARSGPGSAPLRQTPDWNALFGTADVQDRAIYELILFVATFFHGREDTGEDGLAVNRFDALIRSLIPIAAKDSGLPVTPDTGPSALEQLNQAWLLRGEILRSSSGLTTVRSNSGAIVIKFADSSWRDEVLTVFSSAAGFWLFSRLAAYVRRREFVFGPEDAAQGVMRVAAAQAMLSSVNDSTQLLDWILACTQPQTVGGSMVGQEQLSERLKLLSQQDRVVLGSWVADVLREWQSPTAPAALLGNLVNTGAHDLAAAILRRLWGTEGCGDPCISIARRLLSEAPSETKDEVLDQMRSATRRGDLLLLEIWRRDWLPAEAPDPGAPGRGAARLLVELIESSMGGFRSNQLFRNIFDDQDPAAVNGLVSWLWHPAVDTVIRERETGIAALPGLWMLPEEYRRLVLDGAWEPADTFLTVWWFGLMVGIGDESAINDPLPLVFRAMALADWAVISGETLLSERLSTAITRVLSPKALRALRLVLHGLDAALGDVLQMMLSGAVVRANERRAIEARVRPLREHIRSLRRATVLTARQVPEQEN